MPDLEGLAAVAHEELRVLGDRALVNAEDAELAHERVHHDLEHVGEHVFLRIGLRPELRRRVAFPFVEQRWIAFSRIRRQLDEHVEKLGDARAGLCRHEAHRHEMAVAQRLLERRVQLIGRDLALLQVLRHQRLVDLDHLIDERAMRAAHRREVGFAVGIEEAVDDPLAAAGGQIDRQALFAEKRLDRREQTGQIGILGVDLVDDDKAAQTAFGRPVHHSRGNHLDAGLRADDHRRGLHGIERADRLTEKIGKSGRIDQVDTRVLRIEMHDRCAQRMLPRFFERVEIAHCRATLDGTRFLDRTGREQQRFGQRGLARSALTDERNRTNGAGGVVRHAPVLLRCLFPQIIPAPRAAPASHGKLGTNGFARSSPGSGRPGPADYGVSASMSRRCRSNSSSWNGLPR